FRYTHWINGLSWDWCISRQRHFGVPFPIWYCKKCNESIIADEKDLPVDPLKDKPNKKCKCGGNEFIGEGDVMDTWATSSVSPQIALNWVKDKGYNVNFEKMYPMSLRPQAHDIIRTWAFYTIVKGIYHHDKIPWDNIMISGHIQDSKGRKMSKSLGNVIEPKEILDKYGADAFRFLAASSKLGEDMPYHEKEIVSGQKLVNKLWNASKFCFIHLKDYKFDEVKDLEIMDKWLLIKLNILIEECTKSFEEYEYSKPKVEIEKFFFHTFCDNYLEIIKDRLYNPQKRGNKNRISAQYILYISLLNILKLLAPIMPFVTEEIYQSYFIKREKTRSIHLSNWPNNKKLIDNKIEKIGDEFIRTLNFVRQKKAEKNLSLKEPVKFLRCSNFLDIVVDDLKAVTNAQEIKFGILEL
ncbi:MAG: class I tRNA ligase family protein, partial [Nanoarchaeota archaeon]|nr:class I tRNA ligase family protein [Nanoarchaeota archaeon]